MTFKMPRATASLKVMTYNVHSCVNIFGRENPSAVARVIADADPDVAALQEVESLNPDMDPGLRNQAAWLGARLGMDHHFLPLRRSRWGNFGLAFLSKPPFSVVKAGILPGAGEYEKREARGAIWCRLETRIGPVDIINTHLGLRARERRRQITTLLSGDWLGGFAPQAPVIFCGDLNAGVRSPVYRAVSLQYKDVQRASGQHGYPKATFLSFYPVLRLDHIFVSRQLKTLTVKVPLDLKARTASDHLPVCARLAQSDAEQPRRDTPE